jgi:hypothetical protein
MPISDAIKQQRQSAKEHAIISTLTYPMTAMEVAESLRISYYTIQPILRDMANRGLIQQSPFKQGGAVRYERLVESALPMVQNNYDKSWVTLKDIVDLNVKRGANAETDASNAARALGVICYNVIALARRAEVGLAKEADVTAFRHQLTELYRLLSVPYSIYEQLVTNDSLWTLDAFKRIASSPDFPSDEELTRYAEVFGS